MNAITRTSVLFGSLILMTAGPAAAFPVVEAKVPFSFTVRDQVMPAGRYRVERDQFDPSVLTIRGENGMHVAVVTESYASAGRDPAGDAPALVFSHGPDGYRLKDVWDDHLDGREIPAPER